MRCIQSIFIVFLCIVATSTKPMGLDVSLVSKHKGPDQIYYYKFSRSFCNFLCGPDAYEISEFQQIEQQVGLDLKLFRSYPVNMEPDVDELEYQKYLAEEANDAVKIKEIEQKIVQVEAHWNANFDSINEGWIEVEALERLTKKLISQLEAQPNLEKQLHYNFNWSGYFKFNIKEGRLENDYFDHTLVEDLYSLLKGLSIMKNKGVKYVAFHYN